MLDIGLEMLYLMWHTLKGGCWMNDLRTLRLKKRMRLREVAAAADLSEGHLSKIERGVQKYVPPWTIEKIAGAMGVDFSEAEGAIKCSSEEENDDKKNERTGREA